MTTLNGKKVTYRDFYRFTVLTPLKASHNNKNIFCFGTLYSNFLSEPDVDRRLRRMVDFGFGAAVWLEEKNKLVEKRLSEKLASYNLAIMGRPVINKWTKGGFIVEDGQTITNLQEVMVNASDELLKKYEDICALKAKNRPWVKVWYFSSEVEGFQPLVGDERSLAKVLAATYRGIKRGNPEAIVHTGCAPWNITVENGQKEYERYLKGLKEIDAKVKFDGTNIHVYQHQPEDPDFDNSIAAMLKMLKRYGYDDVPIYMDEGVNYFDYQIPNCGFTPYHGNSGSKWFIGKLSYDVGNAERIAAAFTARTFLVGLKYRKNIACIFDFDYLHYFWDMDYTSGGKMKMFNTLNRLLGNAVFREDLRFASNSRAYVFDNGKNIPVAALWTADKSVDKFEKKAPVFEFDFGKMPVTVLDMMENPVKKVNRNGKRLLEIGSFPIFIIGKPGKFAEMHRAIITAKQQGRKSLPITVDCILNKNRKAVLRLSNPTNHTFNVKVQAELNRNVRKENIVFRAADNKSIVWQLPEKTGFIQKLSWRCTMQNPEFDVKNVSGKGFYCRVKQAAINLDGKPDDWQNIPFVKLGAGAKLRLAYSNKKLCAALELPKSLRKKKLILALNPLPTVKNWHQERSLEQDIFIFELRNTSKNHKEVFVHAVPGVQAASGSQTPKAHVVDRRIQTAVSANGSFIEIAFPAISILPIKPVPGGKFGINLIIGNKADKISLVPSSGTSVSGIPEKMNFVLTFLE